MTSGVDARWRSFFGEHVANDVRSFVRQYPAERSLYVDVFDLHRFDADFVEALFADPDDVLERGVETLRAAHETVGRANLRLTNLPSQLGLRSVRARHVSKLVTVAGVVKTVDSVGAAVVEAVYVCPACGETTRVRPRGVELPDPDRCDACETPDSPVLDDDRSTFVDVQRVELAEPDGATNWAGTPRRIDVYLDDDLVDTVEPPDSLLVTGVVRLSQRGAENRFSYYLDALTVEQQRAGRPAEAVDVPERLKESIRSRWEFVVGE